jgi:FkbM family methyltransferase
MRYKSEFIFDNQIARFLYVTVQSNSIREIGVDVYESDELVAFRDIKLYKSNEISDRIYSLIVNNSYEYDEIETSKYVLDHRKDNSILELGASFGGVSSFLLSKYSVEKYICVEANYKMVQLMEENHYVNSVRAEILHGVMSNNVTNAEINFYVHRDCFASSLTPSSAAVRVEKVKTYDFRRFLRALRPTFIICDIEGGEYDLFTDAVIDCLDSVDDICIEVHGNSEKNIIELFSLFEKCNLLPTIEYDQEKQKKVFHFTRSKR